eukprot:gene6065-biopygen7066
MQTPGRSAIARLPRQRRMDSESWVYVSSSPPDPATSAQRAARSAAGRRGAAADAHGQIGTQMLKHARGEARQVKHGRSVGFITPSPGPQCGAQTSDGGSVMSPRGASDAHRPACALHAPLR